MKNSRLLLFVVWVLLNLGHTSGLAQSVPVCDSGGVCGPDPTDPSYRGIQAARAQKQNARGTHNPTMALASARGTAPMNVGSQSYNKAIPILSLPGRGLNLDLALYYNSGIWTLDSTDSLISFNADRDFPSPGFRLDFGFIETAGSASVILTEADGSKHALLFASSVLGGALYDSNDGTFIEYNSANKILSYRNGTAIQYQQFPTRTTLLRPVQIKDTNRNFISISYVAGSGNDQHIDTITDTLNRQIKFVYDGNNHLQKITQAVSPSTDASGTRTWATFNWSNSASPVTFTYSFSGLTVVSSPAKNTAMNVLIGCTYPNNTGYKFSYGAWGLVSRIDLLNSAGQTRSYESYNYPDASQALTDVPAYTTMTVSKDGTSTSPWNYAVTKAGLGQVTSETISDPYQTSSIFAVNSDGTSATAKIKDVNGKLFRSMNYSWITVGSNQMIGSVTSADDAGNQATLSYSYDTYGNVTDYKQFDFNGQLIREVQSQYAGAPLTTQHILNRPAVVKILDNGGIIRGRTEYSYDSTTITPIAGLVGNDGDTTTPRGNPTRISSYSDPATPGGKEYVQATYDQGGNMVVSQPDCCDAGGSQVPNVNAQTFFSFDPVTQYTYLQSITKGRQIVNSYVFNPDNGLLQVSSDINGQQTSYDYDSLYRVSHITTPPSNGQTVRQTFEYSDASISPQVTTTSTVNTTKIVQTFDGLGHLTEQDTVDVGTGNTVSTTQHQYDQIWRRTATSNPYSGSDPIAWTTTGYDVLNRLTSVTPPSNGGTTLSYLGNTVLVSDPAGKQRKNFVDASGRLVRVDEPGWGDALTAIDGIAIPGSERSKTFVPPPPKCPRPPLPCDQTPGDPVTVYDTGTVTATINGVPYSYNYGQGDSTSTVATSLAAKINADPARLVNASPSGSTVNLYAVNPGVGGNNISVNVSSVTSNPSTFGTGTTSFPASTFTPTLTGGENAVVQANAVLSATRHLTTAYAYDVFDHIISMSAGAIGPINGQQLSGQPRSFSYDGLGRVTSVTTPEAGTVSSYYITAGGSSCSADAQLVCRTIDARSITTTYTYNDPLNRLTGTSYSDNSTPPVSYSYDAGGQQAFALGRVTSITEDVITANPKNSRSFTYDNLGRVTSVSHTIDGIAYVLQYGYNAANQTTSITYPSGRIINAGYDTMGRLTAIADSSNSAHPYLSINSSDYNAAGLVKAISYGNLVSAAYQYNDHLQVSQISYSSPTASSSTPDILNLLYDYVSSSNSGNNGQVQAVHFLNSSGLEDLSKSTGYAYDAWSRLSQAQSLSQTVSGAWLLQWAYDRLNNRTSQSGTGSGTIGQPNLLINPATNQITTQGYQYDAVGNMTHDPAAAYGYDAANRLITIINNGGTSPTAAYTYSGSSRIKKAMGGISTIYIYSGEKPIAEYAAGAMASNPSKEYIYGGSSLIASVANSTIAYYHQDNLSNRAETDGSGTLLRALGHFPFGESWYDSSLAEKWKFTTYERDSGGGETGLDYATARYYSSGLARFSEADPLGGEIGDPESLNRYSYAGNDPVNKMDPTGRKVKVCTLLNGTGDEAFFCIKTENFLDDPFGRGGASVGSFAVDYVPGLGYVFLAPPGFSVSVGGVDGIALPCFAPGACPTIGVPSLSQYLSSFLPKFCDPMSPISDGCGLTSFAANSKGLFSGLFGTNYCGRGPSKPDGTTDTSVPTVTGRLNGLDEACKAHDLCYDKYSVTLGDNFNLFLPKEKERQLYECNQALCVATYKLQPRWPNVKDQFPFAEVRAFFSTVPEGSCH